MTHLRLWVPNAKKVQLDAGGKLREMEPRPGGWWSAGERPASAGTDYAFFLDGKGPFPDPRSPSQASGVHGPSRAFDHSAFRWTDERWQAPPLSSAIIYELHIGTFTPEGTFENAIACLPHLVGLGITHVELMPVQEFSGDWGWGYDGVDLYAPHHAYGGPCGLKAFVNACHAAGLAVLLDVVYNHLGPEGNYLSRFGPYFTSKHTTPWGPAINLDGPGSTEVRRFLCDNALMWLRDYHFDGLRIDAIHAIFDSSAIHFLEQLAREVEELEAQSGRRLVLIAESDLNDPRVVTSWEGGGYGIDAQWSDDFHHALHTALTGERSGYYEDFGSLAAIAKALTNVFVYDGEFSNFRQRRHGRKVKDLPGWRFLGYLQNHDQVGNRAKGERMGRLTNIDRLKIGAALVFCSPFIPMLFQGEEFGASTPFAYFTNHQDPKLAKAVIEGRRREFEALGWKPEEILDPQDPQTFLRSKLDWSEPDREPHASLLEWHRKLITLRKTTPALCDGRLDRINMQFDEGEKWLTLKRGPIILAANLSSACRTVPVPSTNFRVLLSSSDSLPAPDSAQRPARDWALPSSPDSPPRRAVLCAESMESPGSLPIPPDSVIILEE